MSSKSITDYFRNFASDEVEEFLDCNELELESLFNLPIDIIVKIVRGLIKDFTHLPYEAHYEGDFLTINVK